MRGMILAVLIAFPSLSFAGEAKLTWSHTAPATVANYEIWQSQTGSAADFIKVPNLTLPATTMTVTLPSLPGGKTFWWYVKACNSVGCSGPSPTVSKLIPVNPTPAPATPTNFQVEVFPDPATAPAPALAPRGLLMMPPEAPSVAAAPKQEEPEPPFRNPYVEATIP